MSDFGKANEPVPAPHPPAQSGGDDLARLINDAKTSMKARDYEAAKLGFRGVYDALARRGLGEGLEAMDCLADLGATHMALKEYDMALLEYGRLASIMERSLGEANAELRQHLRRYAQACDVCGKVGEAKQLYGRANDLERRYGQPSTRSHAGGLPQLHAGNPSEGGDAGSGKTFTNAIQDAVARSMARLENTKNPAAPTSGNSSAPAQPFGSVPAPSSSPFAHVPPTHPRAGASSTSLPPANSTPVKTPFQSLSFITPNPPAPDLPPPNPPPPPSSPPPNPFGSVAESSAPSFAQAAESAAEEAIAAEHSPGYRRASAEWQLEVGESFPSTTAESENTESALSPEMHPASDSSKAMAQWMVPIDKGAEIAGGLGAATEADRRLPLSPAPPSKQEDQKQPDRRQKPKSMKSLRSRFGEGEAPPPPAPEEDFSVNDAAPAAAETSAETHGTWFDPNHKSGEATSGGDGLPGGLQNLGSLKTGSHSNSGMPALPGQPLEPSLVDSYNESPEPPDVKLPPDMPPPPPPRNPGRNVQLEIGLDNMPAADAAAAARKTGSSTEGDYAVIEDPPQASKQSGFGSGSYLAELDAIRPELKESGETPPVTGDQIPPPQRPSSMFSRLANKRVQDATGQGMPGLSPELTGEDGSVNPRVRSMVDAARANSAEGKFADAARLLQKVVNELAESGLKDGRYIADCMLLLSEAYEASGQIGPAVTSFHQHALMVEKRVGESNYENISNWYRLAILLDKADERADAKTMYEHAINLAMTHLGEYEELTKSIQAGYEEFQTQPPRSQRVSATSIETISPQEVLAQNKELRSSAVLQKQDKPTSKKMMIWSTISVILLVAALTWFVIIMGQLNSSTARIDSAADLQRSTETAEAEIFANSDGDGMFRFAGDKTCDMTIDGQVRRVPVVILQNSPADILTMFQTVQAKRTFWLQKTEAGMLLDSSVTFFRKDAPELAMAAEMRRIGQHVEEYYQLNQSYPRYRQDWEADPQVAYINPISRRGEPSIFHVFPRSATPQALFGGSSNTEEIIDYLEKGNTWIGEPLLKPCSISCAVKQSSEKSVSGKPIVFDFYMHATDTANKFLTASKPGTVSVVVLNSGQNLGNFDLHPKDLQKVEVTPMPDAVAYVSMTRDPLFTPQILKPAVTVILIGVGAIAFFALVFGAAASKNKKRKTEGA